MIDQVNSTERLRMVAESYIKGEELNNKDCTNISQGKMNIKNV